MWDHEIGGRISAILALIANPPHLRAEGGIKVFDGGRLIEDTGIAVFELADGTEVIFGSSRDIHLTIKIPSIGTVNISVTEP